MPPCPYAAAPSPAAAAPETDVAGRTITSPPRATYTQPELTPIEPGHPAYPMAHATALLVRARVLLVALDGDEGQASHVAVARAALAQEISAFVQSDHAKVPAPPPPDTADVLEDPPLAPPLEAFAPAPGSVAAQRLQRGAAMPMPPPPAPAFVPPPPTPLRSPPYSNGCPHPPMRLNPNGRGVTCADCGEQFPGFNPRAQVG